jgi:YHS domain-containing protein
MKFASLALVAALVATFATASFAADKKSKLKTKPYPMDTCVVSGEKLGSMGDSFVFVEGDQEVQLCCKSCQKDFAKEKKANLAKINDAWKKVKLYTATTCIVSGEALENGKAVGVVHEGAEYQFCCKDCVKEFKKDTAKFAKKLAETAAK